MTPTPPEDPRCPEAGGLPAGSTPASSEMERIAATLRASELVHRALFEGAGDYVLVLEILAHGVPVIVDMNEEALSAHGYTREELLGQPVTLIDPFMNPSLGAERARLAQEQPGRPFRVRHRRKDGSLFDVEVKGREIVVEGRRFSIAVERDITERVQAEDALRRSEQRLREAQALARIGHWERHHKEGWTHWSTELYRIHDLDPEGAPPSFEDFLERIHPEDRPAVRSAYEGHLRRGSGDYSLEFRIQLADGGIRHLRSHCTTEFGPDGAPLRTFGTDQDVTERIHEADERRQLEAQLQHLQRLESVGRLAGGVAHDMNNVLAAILAVATQLHQKGGSIAAGVELILKACLRGRDLVKGLLDFARKEVESSEVVDLHQLLREEAELLARTTLGRIRIELDLQAEPSLTLGDAGGLANAFMNLCVNAVDAMPAGGRLRISTRLSELGLIEVRVEDTGPGMSAQVLEHAIEPFFTTKPVGKGTGLGLSIAYGAAKAHGGSLEIRSEEGKGTCVLFRVPACIEALPPPPQEWDGPSQVRPLRILFVDDDPLIRETAPAMLESAGHRVQVASSGRQALALVEAGLEVDALVLDLNMPGMDGEATLDSLRRIRPSLPAVVTTGYADWETVEGLLRRGLVLVLPKPYSVSEIQGCLLKLGGAAWEAPLALPAVDPARIFR